jgi:hypothetical protein
MFSFKKVGLNSSAFGRVIEIAGDMNRSEQEVDTSQPSDSTMSFIH